MARPVDKTTLPQSSDAEPAKNIPGPSNKDANDEADKARDGDHGPQRPPAQGAMAHRTRKVRVINGIYIHGGRTYTPADGWFDTNIDLVGRFGNKKFQEQ